MKHSMIGFVVFVFFCFPCLADFDYENLLSVSGTGQVKIAATIADVRVGIEVYDQTAQGVQKKLAQQQQRLLKALKKENAEKVETGDFRLTPRYHKEKSTEVIGYIASTSVTFSASVERAGPLLDVALTNGANKTYGVYVHPTEQEIKKARAEALKLAVQKANNEAQMVMEEMRLHYKKTARVQITPEYGSLQQKRNFAGEALTMSSPARSQVSEREWLVNASINVEIEYEE